MGPEALWSFEFIDNQEHHGGGIAVFYRDRIMGGNSSFTYTGNYKLRGDEILCQVNVKRFNGKETGIYKDDYILNMKGKFHDLEFIVTGSPDDNDDLIFAVQCTRQGEIP